MDNETLPERKSAILKFYPSYQNNGNGELTIMSIFDGRVVFPSPELRAIIDEQQLIEKSIWGRLELRSNKYSGRQHFLAHPPSDIDNMVIRGINLLGQPVIVLVDGQNLSHALRGVPHLNDFSLLEIIQSVTQLYRPIETIFFTCKEAAIQQGLTNEDQMAEIENDPDITVIDRELKTVRHGVDPHLSGDKEADIRERFLVEMLNRQTELLISFMRKTAQLDLNSANVHDYINQFVIRPGQMMKVDTDTLVAAEAVRMLYQHQEAAGLILFSGDGDFDDIVTEWLGMGRYTSDSSKAKGVHIVSSQKTLSKELRELANCPNAGIGFLESMAQTTT